VKIFVAGATGVLGRRLVQQLTAKGHEVVGLARNAENAKRIRELGGEPRHADMFDVDSLARRGPRTSSARSPGSSEHRSRNPSRHGSRNSPWDLRP